MPNSAAKTPRRKSVPSAQVAALAPTDLNPFLQTALSQGIDDALVIDPAGVVTAPWVRLKCQFGCRGYDQSRCCPPRTPTPDETRRVLDAYHTALLLHVHWDKGYHSDRLNKSLVGLERDLFLAGFYKALALGSGPCRLCQDCDLTACRQPALARPAMEACGIDVYATARNHGLPIQVVRDKAQAADAYGLLLVD
jgi:predicted metal-binding protein